MSPLTNKIYNQKYLRLFVIVPAILAGLLYFSHVYGAELLFRSITLSNSNASAQATYKLSFQLPASETLGSIKLQFCANSPLVGDVCSAPTGFDISAAALGGQTGETGFTILPSASNSNTVVLTRIPTTTAAPTSSYALSGVINPSTGGSFFGRVQTFASTDATGSENEHGGVALSITKQVNISTYVPPYLLFCTGVTITGFDCSTASGDYVNFGNLSSLTTSSGTTQMLTATNAGNGFTIAVSGNTMVSGTNVIPGIPAQDVSRPGTAQFGINLVANTTPSVGSDPSGTGNAAVTAGYDVPNFYKFVPGDTLVVDTDTDEYRLFTTSYIVNIPKGQAVGVYVATLTYICTASF